MPGNGRDNLIPLTERDKESAKAIRSMGGKASTNKRRRKRDMAKTIQMSLESKVDVSEATRASLERLGYDFEARGDPTALDMMIASLTAAAIDGDLNAFKLLARYGLIPDIYVQVEREKIAAEAKAQDEKRDALTIELIRPEDES